LMYNAFSDREKGQSTDSLAKRLKEREAYLRSLKEENLKLKEGLNTLTTNLDALQLQFSETQTNHSNLTLASKDTEEKLSKLKEEWKECQEGWSEEISQLKSKMATMMQEDDEQCSELQSEWDKAQEERDRVREELRRVKEQLTREKEELEARNRKLLKNEKRALKNKEELAEIIANQTKSFDMTMEELRKHFLIHVRDMNVWRPFLEEDRQYKGKQVDLPSLDDLAAEPFNDQVLQLLGICKGENETLHQLLQMYEQETEEIVSVTIGKKQHRTKTYAWEQQFPQDLKAAMLTRVASNNSLAPPSGASLAPAKSPRRPASPRPTTTPDGKEKDKVNKKRDKK